MHARRSPGLRPGRRSSRMPITASASTSSLILIAPSCAVVPAPIVARRTRKPSGRGDQPNVDEGREEAGQRVDADLRHLVVGLNCRGRRWSTSQERERPPRCRRPRQGSRAETDRGDLAQQISALYRSMASHGRRGSTDRRSGLDRRGDSIWPPPSSRARGPGKSVPQHERRLLIS